jgi:hypothetical protein
VTGEFYSVVGPGACFRFVSFNLISVLMNLAEAFPHLRREGVLRYNSQYIVFQVRDVKSRATYAMKVC